MLNSPVTELSLTLHPGMGYICTTLYAILGFMSTPFKQEYYVTQDFDMKQENTEKMVQSAVRLPQSLHDRLKKAGGERGMGEEIRRRLEASFDAEKVLEDPKTRELINAISFADEELVRDFGSWSKDRFAFEVFRESLNTLLKQYEPKGEPVPVPNPDGLAEILYAKDPSAEDVSRFLVGSWIRDQPKRAFAKREKRS